MELALIIIISGFLTYLVIYTILVTPRNFTSCLFEPIRYLNRKYEIKTLGNAPEFKGGNTVYLVKNGDQAMRTYIDLIRVAKENIRWNVMIFKPDEAGSQFARELAGAARRGVNVQLSFNINLTTNGSIADPIPLAEADLNRKNMNNMLGELRSAGVIVIDSKAGADYPLSNISPHSRDIQENIVKSICISFNHYDHRKILIVDDSIAVVGGMNVGSEYFYWIPPTIEQDALEEAKYRQDNGLAEGWEKWFDVAMKVEGPVIQDLIDEFNWHWEVLGGKPLLAQAKYSTQGNTIVQILPQRPGDGQVGNAYIKLIDQAQREVLIASPYISYDELLDSLINARRRGVRVIIIFPHEHNNIDLSKSIMESRAKKLVDAGVEVYYNDLRMTHSKVMVVDQRWTIIGSFNLNHRSFRHDLEIAGVVDKNSFANQVITDVFEEYISISIPVINPPPARFNLIQWIKEPFS